MATTRVAVIGGGIAGCSALYHLTRLGCADVTLIEQNELTSGSTWHAAGLCTHFIRSPYLMRLLRVSLETYREIGQSTDTGVGFHQCGSVRLATDENRVMQFQQVAGIAEQVGVPFEIVEPGRVQELFPLASVDGVIAGAHLPTDGHIDPATLTMALANAATAAGARIVRHTAVTSMEHTGGRWRLRAGDSEIIAETVLNAAGQWARHVARLGGADLPINALEHQYVLTEPIPEVAQLGRELPVLRDPDGSYYIRQEGDALIVGPFERNPLPFGANGIPAGFHGRLLPGRFDQIESVLVAASKRVPLLESTGLKTIINGPDAYTPDGKCLMGPIPGTRGFHVLAGFSIFGIVFGGGAGRFAAEWILRGEPSEDMWELDVRRFGPYAVSPGYVLARARDVYEREYAIEYPEEERSAARPLKTGPLYDRLRANGAVFGARFGWERPLWFARGGPAIDRYSFARGNWFGAVGKECRGVRSGVGVLDQTSFAKFEVSGPGASAFLDRLCANAIPTSTGHMALTQMCTQAGGIECDVTVTQLCADRYYIVSAAAAEQHDLAWLNAHVPEDGSVRVDNISSAWGVLTLAGPGSRELLQGLTSTDCSRESFPFFTCRDMYVGMAPVRALRVSYVGELGYELHHPLEYQLHIYDRLRSAGRAHGLVDFGYRALDSLRLEKGYRLWGSDLGIGHSPLEAGMERFVDFDKGDFIGREALLAQRERGVLTQLACLAIDTQSYDAHGYESVKADGRIIGYVTSGGYGHAVGVSIALAYMSAEYAVPGVELGVDLLGRTHRAQVVAAPIYDPANERLRA